ncbi:hypothetical protein [Desulfopila sp. IMCC35008]|uniref:hypothetical protein n=1 Tax=Desulfopila sp. IMCC35008 TaxID=2653858 RepID=UPI002714FD27|nr:hypothetical protein [Desulfopila sp. IMCC35008]
MSSEHSKNNKIQSPWITQKELASRWQVSQSTIINYRNKGELLFFRLPGSTRVLYPLDEILKLEGQHTTKEVQIRQQQLTEIKRKKPVVSTKPQKEWRV